MVYLCIYIYIWGGGIKPGGRVQCVNCCIKFIQFDDLNLHKSVMLYEHEQDFEVYVWKTGPFIDFPWHLGTWGQVILSFLQYWVLLNLSKYCRHKSDHILLPLSTYESISPTCLHVLKDRDQEWILWHPQIWHLPSYWFLS